MHATKVFVVLILLLALTLFGVPLAAEAQPAGKVPRIGVLMPDFPGPQSSRSIDAFRQGLRDLGYVEGQTITIESRWAEGRTERFSDLAVELVRLKPDVIVTSGAPAVLAAKQATSTIPIVMAQINDPVGLGLVGSLARPAGNITGLANVHSELAGKQLELLKEAEPKVSRLAVLWNPANPGAELFLRHMRHASQAVGVTLQPVEIRDPSEIETGFAVMIRQRANALLLPPDPLFLPHGKQIVDLAAKNRLAAMYGWSELAESGGLMAYGPSIPDMFRRAATYVEKILKGAKPGDLPIEQPTKFELVINLKTANALGITIPQSLLQRADEVIQ
jgi:putative ABC transport system substrate-binding protein